MSQQPKLQLDGQDVGFSPGETVLEVARRVGREIPTLCWDERLDPAGACRLCLVEVEGSRLMQPACALLATDGMQVRTQTERTERNRRFILALHTADSGGQKIQGDRAVAEDVAPSRLMAHNLRYGTADENTTRWPEVVTPRQDRPHDENPYVGFRAERCIGCSLCTRYCDEIEGVSAITMAGRGAMTTVSTADRLSLEETTCEMCGGCIAVCPTGAMVDKTAMRYHEATGKAHRELDVVRTTCNFCGVGCQLDLHVDRERERVAYVTAPEPGTTVNDGNLCVKGRFANDFIHHPDRLTTPLVRDASGQLVPETWDEALERAASGLRAVEAEHGSDALAFISSSRCTVEENYLVQKMARAVFSTHNVHQCAAT